MRTIFAATLVASVTVAIEMNPKEYDFMRWISEQARSYTTKEEYAHRLENWLINDEYIQKKNSDPTSRITVGHNQFSDFTKAEYKKLLTHKLPEEMRASPATPQVEQVGVSGAYNWATDSSCVTPVKNQEQCGSCWAFSATETLESAYCIDTGILYKLSPQQLVDCSTQDDGCNGGLYQHAWNYLRHNGQEAASNYRYLGVDGYCKYNSSLGLVKTTSSGHNITGSSITDMQDRINQQPISISIDASGSDFMLYTSGIMTPSDCGVSIDHAVAITGYNFDGSMPYYIVRNSWGTGWGNAGYINFEAVSTYEGTCGMNTSPMYVGAAAW